MVVGLRHRNHSRLIKKIKSKEMQVELEAMIKQRKRLLWLWKKSFLQVEYSLDKVTTATISISITMTITRGQIMTILVFNKLQNKHLQLMFKSQLIIVQHLLPSDPNINSSKYLY